MSRIGVSFSVGFSLLLLKFFLDISYFFFVSKEYEYQGYYSDFSWLSLLVSYSFVVLPMVLLKSQSIRPSDVFNLVFVTGLYLPFLSMFGMGAASVGGLLVVTIFYFFAFFFPFLTRLSVPGFPNKLFFIGILIGVSALFIFNFVHRFGGVAINFDITKVYDYRGGLDDTVATGIFAYINVWFAKIIVPITIIFAVYKRSVVLLLLAMCFWVISFLVTQSRSVAFFPIFVLFIYFWARLGAKNSLFILSFSCLTLFSFLMYVLLDTNFMASLFVRRFLFSAALNVDNYFLFFSHNDFVFWSNTALSRWFLSYPYELPPGMLIGSFKGVGGNANTSTAATGYMHLGFAGVCIYGIGVGMLLNFIDRRFLRTKVPLILFMVPIILPLRGLLLSTDLVVSVFSQGLFLSIVLLYLMPSSIGRMSNRSYIH